MMEDKFDLEKLNEKQREALNEMKKRFENFTEPNVRDEYFLLDWLIARKYDVNAAEEMLKNNLRFRKALKQDDPSYINCRPVEIAYKYYTHGKYGFDKEGRPIIYCAYGLLDSQGLIRNVKTSDLYRGMAWFQNGLKLCCNQASNQFNKRVHQSVCIFDLNGLNAKHLWKPGIQIFQNISDMLQNNYPEITYRIYIINAPPIFSVIFNLIKPMLDINLQQKIFVCTANYKEILLKDIDENQLPVYYGGTVVDSNGDPKCSEHIFYGGPIPSELYYKKPEKSEPGLTEVHIGGGKQMLISLKIDKIGAVIKWYIEFDPDYEEYDIGFGLYKKYNDLSVVVKDMEMIVPYFRLFCGFVPEDGEYVAEEVGTCKETFCSFFIKTTSNTGCCFYNVTDVALLDNSYSWVHGKKLKCKLLIDEINVNLLQISDQADLELD